MHLRIRKRLKKLEEDKPILKKTTAILLSFENLNTKPL